MQIIHQVIYNIKQEKECTCKITLRYVRATIFCCGNAISFTKPACESVVLLRYPACNAHAPYYTVVCDLPALQHFSNLSPKRHDFRKMLLTTECEFWFSLQIMLETGAEKKVACWTTRCVTGSLSFNPLAVNHVPPDVSSSYARTWCLEILFRLVFTVIVYFDEEVSEFRLCCGHFSPTEI